MATVDEIAKFFDTYVHDGATVEIKGGKVTDLKKFVSTSISTLKANSGNKAFLPHYNRLVSVYNICKKM